jgi:uncharacterized protein YcfJ
MVCCAAAAGYAQAGAMIYPAKGQTPEQQQKDDAECYAWAKSSTGIDPATIAATPSSPPPAASAGGPTPVQGAARGAVRGAVGGAVIGKISGDTNKGAKIGATVGAMAGGARARQQQQQQQQQQQAQQSANEAQKQAAMDKFNRAHAACMEGRGYTIK